MWNFALVDIPVVVDFVFYATGVAVWVFGVGTLVALGLSFLYHMAEERRIPRGFRELR